MLPSHRDSCCRILIWPWNAQRPWLLWQVAPHINVPRPAANFSTSAQLLPTERRFRQPDTDDANRVASVLEHVVAPVKRLEELAHHIGVSVPTVSLQLRADIPNMIAALRHELPALVTADVLRETIEPIGLLLGCRLIVDTTDTKIQDLVDSFNVHHKYSSVKSLIVVSPNGSLVCVEVGFGGSENDGRILENSEFYRRLHPYLKQAERILLGDGAFRKPHVWFPLNATEVRAAGSPSARHALNVYNREVQLYRARVEHAIGHAKARFGAIREIPGIMHMNLSDLINVIFLAWLLEARYQRLNFE